MQSWIPGLITLLFLLSINLISARVFGNLEFSFAIIKIVTIIAFVILIFYLLITNSATKYGHVSWQNMVIDGGIFAKGPKGFFLGSLASAAVNPIRIILFYVLAFLIPVAPNA